MIALLAALLPTSHAAGPEPLSAELRMLLHSRTSAGPRSSEAAALLARPDVRVVIAVDGAFDVARLGGTSGPTLGRWRAATVPWDRLEAIAQEPGVTRIELGPSFGLRPPTDHSATLIGVDQLRARPGAPRDGRGMLVVDFDTGADWRSAALLRPDGGLFPFADVDGDGELTPGMDTLELDGAEVPIGLLDATVFDAFYDDETTVFGYRPRLVDPAVDVLFADQDADGDPDRNEPQFVAEDLDGSGRVEVGEELVGLSTSKVSATWDAESGLRTRDQGLTGSAPDTNGHGTQVASVLMSGAPGLGRWPGLAPGVDLAAFSYTHAYELFDWVTAIDQALALEPDVLLFEVGDYSAEFADGSSAFEEALVAAADQGVVQVCPAGNIGGGGKHGQRLVRAGGGTAGLYVYGPQDGYEVSWIVASVVTRSGPIEALAFVDGNTGQRLQIPIDTDWVSLGNHWLRGTSDRSSRGTHMVVVEWVGWDDPAQEYVLLEGFGYLEVDPEEEGDIHLWLSDDGSSWSGGAVNLDPSWGFEPATSWANADSSATVPSTSDACVTLGSFQARADVYGGDETPIVDGPLSWFSGEGPRIDGAPVVDLAAPGNYDIRAIGSSEVLPENGWTLFGGTSAAGPHVAAAAAILRQVAPGSSHEDVEAALTEAASRSGVPPAGPYDQAWGFGRLQVEAAATAVDVLPPRLRIVRRESRWSPLVQLHVVPDEALDGAPQCTSSAGEVPLFEVGPGIWQGTSPEAEITCEGTDLAGNTGSAIEWVE